MRAVPSSDCGPRSERHCRVVVATIVTVPSARHGARLPRRGFLDEVETRGDGLAKADVDAVPRQIARMSERATATTAMA